MTRKTKCADNVSEICNKLADKHDLNVTVVRDLVEDLRRKVFRATYIGDGAEGFDIYKPMRGEWFGWAKSLARTHKPAKRKAGK